MTKHTLTLVFGIRRRNNPMDWKETEREGEENQHRV